MVPGVVQKLVLIQEQITGTGHRPYEGGSRRSIYTLEETPFSSSPQGYAPDSSAVYGLTGRSVTPALYRTCIRVADRQIGNVTSVGSNRGRKP